MCLISHQRMIAEKKERNDARHIIISRTIASQKVDEEGWEKKERNNKCCATTQSSANKFYDDDKRERKWKFWKKMNLTKKDLMHYLCEFLEWSIKREMVKKVDEKEDTHTS